MPDPQQVAELFFAHAKVRSAVLQIAEVSRGCRELEKLASELMTMACVTEIVAHAVQDEVTLVTVTSVTASDSRALQTASN